MDTKEIIELISLYNIPSKSGDEEKLTKKVCKLFKDAGCTVVKKKENNGKNLYITKGELSEGEYYPCIAAHLDEVHDKRGKYIAYQKEDGTIKGWSYTNKSQCGIGADDKNGIWVALQAARKLDKVKVVLFHGEEVGCLGSSKANLEFFKDCRYVLQVDRKGKSDLITNIGFTNMVSDKFMEDIAPIQGKYGRKEDNGLITDVLELVERGVGICCVNMSCGYYNAHTSAEYTVISELQETLDFVMDICTNITERYEYEHVYEYSYDDRFDWGRYSDSSDDYSIDGESFDYRNYQDEIRGYLICRMHNLDYEKSFEYKDMFFDEILYYYNISLIEYYEIFNEAVEKVYCSIK